MQVQLTYLSPSILIIQSYRVYILLSWAAAEQEAANTGRVLMVGCGDVKDAGRLVPAPFLVKTYRLVDDPFTDHIVSWGDQNNTFVVWQPKEFSASLLPSYFNHTNFSSFVRQLNNYGFRKTVRGRCEFSNKLFWKGQQHLLSRIRRRKSSSTSTAQASRMVEYDESLSLIPNSSFTVQDSAVPAAECSLSEENEILKRNNALLLSEIDRLQNICTGISRSLFRTTPGISTERLPGLTHLNRPKIGNAMDRKTDNLSRSSFMTDVAQENNVNPPELFGVPLY